MSQKAPDNVYLAALNICATLKKRGYSAERVSSTSIRVNTPKLMYLLLNVHHTHKAAVDPERTQLSVRVVGHVHGNTLTTQETSAYADWSDTFDRVRHRTQAAYEAIESPLPPSEAVTAALDLIREQNVPLPQVTQQRPEDVYVYLTYEHGTVRCRVRNAGMAAFALWHLKD